MGADEEAVVKFVLAETRANGKSGKVIGAMQFSRPQGVCPPPSADQNFAAAPCKSFKITAI
jgi:hypothetical protein